MRSFLQTYAPYLVLSLSIMLPLFLPGFVLTLDLVFTPHLRAPASLSNDWLWQNLLHYLNAIVPSQLIEKTILTAIPLLAGIGMHQLLYYLKKDNGPAEPGWYWARYVGGILYAINPFTYSRFMAGQYEVLLGYALMPFFVRLTLHFLDKPARNSMSKMLAVTLVISIISIHAIGEMALISLVLFGWATLRPGPSQLKSAYLRWGLLAVTLFVILSSYWLVPLVLGKGSTASTINQFNGADAATFATAGGGKLFQLSNILKLQGFWAEPRGLYRLPQDQLAGWGTLRLIIWILIIWGAIAAWKQRRGLTTALDVIGLISIVFALGIPQQALTHLGYREPQKFVGLLALVFSIFIAYGAAQLLNRVQQTATVHTVTAIVLLLVVLVFTPTIYWGFGGQLKPHEYPTSWQQANAWLNRDNSNAQTLFLPWHEYMSFGFSGRIIGNPATRFFDKPVVISNNPELGQLSQPQTNPVKAAISQIINQHDGQLAKQLAQYRIKYVLLAEDDDYANYRYLASTPNLHIAWQASGLKIYRNDVMEGTN